MQSIIDKIIKNDNNYVVVFLHLNNLNFKCHIVFSKNIVIVFYVPSLDYLLGVDNEKNTYDTLTEPNYEKFILRYKELLKSNNTNHKQLSTNAKFNRNLLVYWNKNKSLPTLDILYKIAIHLKTSVDYLIGRTD